MWLERAEFEVSEVKTIVFLCCHSSAEIKRINSLATTIYLDIESQWMFNYVRSLFKVNKNVASQSAKTSSQAGTDCCQATLKCFWKSFRCTTIVASGLFKIKGSPTT